MTSVPVSVAVAAATTPSSSVFRPIVRSSVPPAQPAGPVTNNALIIQPKTSIKKIIKRIFKRKGSRHSNQEDTAQTGDRSIKSLGTIELDNSKDMSEDDCGFGLYAYEDIDRFHNARYSSHSSFSLDTVRLYRAASSRFPDLDENSVSSLCSAPDTIPEHEQEQEEDQEEAWNEANVPLKETKTKDHGLTRDSDSDSLTKSAAPQDLDTEMEMLSNRLSNLFQEGKEQFELGCYEKAWEIQIEALAYVSSYWFETQGQHYDQDQQDASLSFFARQDAMIRYELAKITYYETREQSNTTSPAYHIRLLSKLHDKVENARCKLALRNYQYYISQLRGVEESMDRSDLNQVYNKLYILHNLGTLCEKDLHRYKEALRYYNHALRIEEKVWIIYMNESKEEIENDGDADDGVGMSAHVKDFAQRRRCTRRKIGRIQHTCLGRFDLALLSSIAA
jgi:tetratricopeptide (TPR) repeat protein